MKQEESLNRKDWTPYKMKRDFTPLILIIGIISYSFLASFILRRFIIVHDIMNILLFIVGITFGFIALKFMTELVEYLR